ncbi:hypothetical protein B0H13DRAFT_1916584 [Mycena leptocephala]|nr:hypothetical protein B0H13DRAFT_1916584 [Mycena leptocephala]
MRCIIGLGVTYSVNQTPPENLGNLGEHKAQVQVKISAGKMQLKEAQHELKPLKAQKHSLHMSACAQTDITILDNYSYIFDFDFSMFGGDPAAMSAPAFLRGPGSQSNLDWSASMPPPNPSSVPPLMAPALFVWGTEFPEFQWSAQTPPQELLLPPPLGPRPAQSCRDAQSLPRLIPITRLGHRILILNSMKKYYSRQETAHPALSINGINELLICLPRPPSELRRRWPLVSGSGVRPVWKIPLPASTPGSRDKRSSKYSVYDEVSCSGGG